MNKTTKIGLIALAVVAFLMMINQMYEVVVIGKEIRLVLSLIASIVVVVLLVQINRSQKQHSKSKENMENESGPDLNETKETTNDQ
jgi:L-lactate permease